MPLAAATAASNPRAPFSPVGALVAGAAGAPAAGGAGAPAAGGAGALAAGGAGAPAAGTAGAPAMMTARSEIVSARLATVAGGEPSRLVPVVVRVVNRSGEREEERPQPAHSKHRLLLQNCWSPLGTTSTKSCRGRSVNTVK